MGCRGAERTRRGSGRVGALAASLVLLAACGGGGPSTVSFDSTPPIQDTATSNVESTSSIAATTPSTDIGSSVPATAPAWVDATTNLIGLDSECGNMSFLSAREDRDQLIAGIAAQGLWVSENGSDQWTRIGGGAGSATIDNRPTSIVYDPADPNSFWESGSYGAGVFRTGDSGSTFKRLGDVDSSDLVSIDLSDPSRQTLLSGTHEQRTVYRSTDGGSSWTDISAGLPANIGYASFPHVIDAQTYLVGTKSGQDSGVFRTTDGGTTWALVHAGGVSGPPLVTRSDGHLYWLLEQGGGLITSSDGGATWTELLGWGPAGGTAGSLIELPDGRFATLGPSNVVVSADQGAHWRAIGPNLPFEPSGLMYSPSRQAFYAWHLYCDLSVDRNPVVAGSIMRLDVDLQHL